MQLGKEKDRRKIGGKKERKKERVLGILGGFISMP
jgi:hypothetical protein